LTESTSSRPPDRPPVPRAHRSASIYIALVFSLVVSGGYTALAYSQREFGEPERAQIPSSVRSSPGGYRSYHFWHSGYHGGK
jgi:hypothetical protein